VYSTKPRGLACVALSESSANESSLCFISTEQSGNTAQGVYGLWRDHLVAKMASHQLGESRVLQRFLPANLSN
jgi:hypothetical protein